MPITSNKFISFRYYSRSFTASHNIFNHFVVLVRLFFPQCPLVAGTPTHSMAVEQFFIVNKSGGMIYNYEKNPSADTNSLLVLTSVIHSLNELSRNVFKLSEMVQTVSMRNRDLCVFRTLTNLTFIFVYDKEELSPRATPRKLFELVFRHFCDYVMANPFYQIEMPINCAKFRPDKYFSN